MPPDVDLAIEKMVYGGDGLARVDGKSVFLPFVLPGEHISAQLTQQRRSFSRANLTGVLSPSPHRVHPGCPYFGQCGGCHYQHADDAAQLTIKRDIFIETLRRTGGIELHVPLQLIASPEPWGYRNRTRMHIEQRPRFLLGYYRAGSHALLDVDQCPISSPLLNRTLQMLRQLGEAGAIPPQATEVEVFADAADRQCLLELYTRQVEATKDLESLAAKLRTGLPECIGVHIFSQDQKSPQSPPMVRPLLRSGAAALDYQVSDHSFRVSAGSFFQVNRFLLPRLAELVVGEAHGDRALDLYAGAGLFAVPLSLRFREVIAVEVAPSSHSDLEANVPANCAAFRQSTESFLRAHAPLAASCDLAIVDPPRSGLGPQVAHLLANVGPRQITYVSCDPATLARDLRVLLESGYRIAEAHLVDMFPQTFHIESVIHLRSGRHDS